MLVLLAECLVSKLTDFAFYFLGDLFDMLLPMLSIYQEYVRNHHYSLQVMDISKLQYNFQIMVWLVGELVCCLTDWLMGCLGDWYFVAWMQ